MYTANIHEAKTHLSQLLEKVSHGEEVLISKAGKPIAKLIPYNSSTARKPGIWRGQVIIKPDFDELPSDMLAAFKGEKS